MSVTRVSTNVPNKYMIVAPTRQGAAPILLAADTLAEAIQDVFSHGGQGVQTIQYNSKSYVWDGKTYVPAARKKPSAKAPAKPPVPVDTFGYSGRVSKTVHPTEWTVGFLLKNHHYRYFVYDTLKAAQADIQKNGGRTKIFHAGQPYLPPVDVFDGVPSRFRVHLPPLNTGAPSSYGDFTVRAFKHGSKIRLYMDATSRTGNETVSFELWIPVNSYWFKLTDLTDAKVLQKNTYNMRYVVELDPKKLEPIAKKINPHFALVSGTQLALRGRWPTGHDQGANTGGVSASGGAGGGFKVP
jgi:hypothetical protein